MNQVENVTLDNWHNETKSTPSPKYYAKNWTETD